MLGESETAALLLGAAAVATFDQELGFPEQAYFTRFEDAAQLDLGSGAYQAAWEAGRRMSWEELQAEMDRLVTIANQPTDPPCSPDRSARDSRRGSEKCWPSWPRA